MFSPSLDALDTQVSIGVEKDPAYSNGNKLLNFANSILL